MIRILDIVKDRVHPETIEKSLSKGSGWHSIPGGKHGGERKQGTYGHWEYRYPSKDAASAAAKHHEAHRGKASDKIDAHNKEYDHDAPNFNWDKYDEEGEAAGEKLHNDHSHHASERDAARHFALHGHGPATYLDSQDSHGAEHRGQFDDDERHRAWSYAHPKNDTHGYSVSQSGNGKFEVHHGERHGHGHVEPSEKVGAASTQGGAKALINDHVKRGKVSKSEGEGSRGGNVIGHTRSGKPIYESTSPVGHAMSRMAASTASAEAHGVKRKGVGNPRKWTLAGHQAAAEAHETAAVHHKHAKGEDTSHPASDPPKSNGQYHDMRAIEHHKMGLIGMHMEGVKDKSNSPEKRRIHAMGARNAIRDFQSLSHGNPDVKAKISQLSDELAADHGIEKSEPVANTLGHSAELMSYYTR